MNIIGHVNRFINIIVETLKIMFTGKIWLVLSGYLLINLLLLFSQYNFSSPFFYSFFKFSSLFFDDEVVQSFTHYPNNYILLPYFVGRLKFVFGILLEGLVLGYVAREMYLRFLKKASLSHSWDSSVFKLWFYLTLGWTLTNGLILLTSIYLPDLLESFLTGHFRRMILFTYLVLPAIYIFIFALFYYVIPIVALSERSLLYGLKNSFHLFKRHPFYTLFFSALVLSGPILISFITNNSAAIVEKFKDDLIFWILAFSIFVEIFANFIWMGTAIKIISDDK